MDRIDNEELKEWSQNQPLSILRLDPIDRAILKISGKSRQSSVFQIFPLIFFFFNSFRSF